MHEYDPIFEMVLDYQEIATIFGFVVLFTAAFPVGPLIAFVGFYMEIRVDAFKLGQHRRPVPRGAQDVGQLEIMTCMSHLASADEDRAQNAMQLARFREVVGTVRAQRFSLCNSAGIALGSEYHFDLTRPGLALYGGVPRGECVHRGADCTRR